MNQVRQAPIADVLIVGGGPVGASLVLALRGSGLRVMLIEARPGGATDVRPLAISYGTALTLRRLSIDVAALAATPIETIHVSQHGGFGRTRMHAAELGVPALGYVLSYGGLAEALHGALAVGDAEVLSGATVGDISCASSSFAIAEVQREGKMEQIAASLVVLADGGKRVEQVSGVRVSEHDYRQSAVVALIKTDPPSATTAYERFTPGGPVALLPYGNGYALVWTTASDNAQHFAGLETAAFLSKLQAHYGAQGVCFSDAGARTIFPLRLRVARPVAVNRVALVGNAAQALHPVAGQGFNLGMRDVQALAKCLRETDREAIGSPPMLARYRAARGWDARAGVAVTDFLVRGFSNDNPLLRAGRGAGLAALDVFPPARNWLARKMMFGLPR